MCVCVSVCVCVYVCVCKCTEFLFKKETAVGSLPLLCVPFIYSVFLCIPFLRTNQPSFSH